MTKRNLARKIREVNKKVSISAFWSFILSLAGYVIAFLVAFPNSSLYGGQTVNPYDVMNISLIIMVVVAILYIGHIIVWLYVKNSSPEVRFSSNRWSRNSVEIIVSNDEPTILKNISMKVLHFSFGNGDNVKGLGNGIINTDYPEEVNKFSKNFIFATVNNGFLFIKFSDREFRNYLKLLEFRVQSTLTKMELADKVFV